MDQVPSLAREVNVRNSPTSQPIRRQVYDDYPQYPIEGNPNRQAGQFSRTRPSAKRQIDAHAHTGDSVDASNEMQPAEYPLSVSESAVVENKYRVRFPKLTVLAIPHPRDADPRVRPQHTPDKLEYDLGWSLRAVSMIVPTTEFLGQEDEAHDSSSNDPAQEIISSDEHEESNPSHPPISDSERPQPAVIDFAQSVVKDGIEGNAEKQNTTWTNAPVQPDDSIEELETSNRSSVIFKRLSYVAKSIVGRRLDRQSGSSDGRSNRYSAFFRRPSYDSHYSKDEADAHKEQKRQSKAIPKSWKFLGIDAPGVEDAVSNVKDRIRSSNFIDMYEKAKIKQERIRRSGIAQLIFRALELTRAQVIANGNSPEPLDDTADVCKQYDVSHTWSPLGSKIIAQFVGCYIARKFPHVLLIDDDCALPPNFPIVSDRLRGNIKCIGYIMKAVGPNGSKGNLCQQAQDLEYKLSGLAKAFAGKVGSVTFPHGAIVLWDRELLVQTFQEHPGFSVSEDWFFGHAARQLGSRITMCTSTIVETETPSAVFFSSGSARGGFGEMTIWSQRFYRWNYFFVTGIYYDLVYILCDWKLGFWEIGAKIFVFQEIYETLLYLLAPFVIPISFATRPIFALEIYVATIFMYLVNALIFNWFHLRWRHESVTFKAFVYYNGFKWVLGFVNIASCYFAIWTYATYFAKRHPKVIEDDRAVEIVLGLEKKDAFVSRRGEIDDLNELMYKIAKPVGGKDGGDRRSVVVATTRPGG
ncbi:MAG: hypothetical protein Q9216_005751 [Gyalolechia sp. 2 TL-2023]